MNFTNSTQEITRVPYSRMLKSEMAVHHVQMQVVGSRFLHAGDLTTQIREVGGQKRRSNVEHDRYRSFLLPNGSRAPWNTLGGVAICRTGAYTEGRSSRAAPAQGSPYGKNRGYEQSARDGARISRVGGNRRRPFFTEPYQKGVAPQAFFNESYRKRCPTKLFSMILTENVVPQSFFSEPHRKRGSTAPPPEDTPREPRCPLPSR